MGFIPELFDRRIELDDGGHVDVINAELETQLSAVHAPKGGVTVQGKHYTGGQWIPGDVVAKASPAEKAKIESGGGDKPAGKPDAKGAFGTLKSIGEKGFQTLAKVGGTIGHWEHVAKEWATVTATTNVAKLPSAMQAVVKGVWGCVRLANAAAFLTFTAGQAFAERVAKEKGATPEQAAKLRTILSTIDVTLLKPVVIGAEMSGLGTSVAIGASFVPVGTMTYLAYSTATNPLATARAAKGAVLAARDKVKAAGGYAKKKIGLSEAAEGADEFAGDVLEFVGDNDYRMALLLHALDETGDCREALELAREAA